MFFGKALRDGFSREPQAADGRRVGTGVGCIRRSRRVKPAVWSCLFGGRGNQNIIGRKVAWVMREPVLVTGCCRLYHGGQWPLPNGMNRWMVGQKQQLPPRVPFPPLGVMVRDGCRGWGASRGERDGGGCWHDLCFMPYPVMLVILSH